MCWHPNTFPQETSHDESPANALLPRTALPSAPRHKNRGCLTASHTRSIHTDKQVLGAESQPQHQPQAAQGLERAGQPSLHDRDTPVALRHRAVLWDHQPKHCPWAPAGLGVCRQPGSPAKVEGTQQTGPAGVAQKWPNPLSGRNSSLLPRYLTALHMSQ